MTVQKILRSRLRPIKRILERFYRMMFYGGTHPVSYFDKKSSEVMMINSSSPLFFKTRFICKKIMDTIKIIHSDVLNENRFLIPDEIQFEYEGDLVKGSIDHGWKNAFCTIEKNKGFITLPIDEQTNAVYFFVGKQLLTNDKGHLKIFLSIDNGKEKIIYSNKIKSIKNNWNLIYYKFTDLEKLKFKNRININWIVDKYSKRLLIGVPGIIKNSDDYHRLIVIVADAVRPIDIGLYSGNNMTPNTDKFFSKGLFFENSYSQNNWTLPTFASMVTSQYSSKHRVIDPDKYLTSLNRNVKTLPEILKYNGFYTYGSVSHFRCNQSLGHHRGFDHFSFKPTVSDKLGSPGVPGPNNMILQIRELCDYLNNFDNKNFFGFIHLFDTHFPYFFNRNRKSEKNLLFESDVSSFVQKSFRNKLKDEEYKFIYDEYLAKLNELDYHLGELYQLIDKLKNTTVIFTSDHGYSFDHSLGKDLNKEEINTPFLIYSNEFALERGRHSRFVESSIDLMPTITNLYSIDDDTKRSGSPIFDKSFEITDKNFAVSELTYLDLYQIKIVGEENCHILIDGKLDRKSLNNKYDSLKVKTCEYGLKSKKDFIYFMDGVVKKIDFEEPFRYKIKELIENTTL